jgi:hypothetical protein
VDKTGAHITDAQLLDLLGYVQEITGKLNIESNTCLTSVEGLRSVTTVGGYPYIYRNTKLAPLGGFRGVTTVDGNLRIKSNTSLTTLEGLHNLEMIHTNTGGRSTSLSLVNNPTFARGLPSPKLCLSATNLTVIPALNAHVASQKSGTGGHVPVVEVPLQRDVSCPSIFFQ